MLFNDLKVEAVLIKIGGLEEALQDYPNDEIEELFRAESLSMIKTDLLIETNQNVLDFDLIATNYENILRQALRLLQRFNIMMSMFADVSGVNETLINNTKKDYDLIKKKFNSFASKSSTYNFSVNSIYL